MSRKIRLLWKKSIPDSNGQVIETVYTTDEIDLPANAKALQFIGIESFFAKLAKQITTN